MNAGGSFKSTSPNRLSASRVRQHSRHMCFSLISRSCLASRAPCNPADFKFRLPKILKAQRGSQPILFLLSRYRFSITIGQTLTGLGYGWDRNSNLRVLEHSKRFRFRQLHSLSLDVLRGCVSHPAINRKPSSGLREQRFSRHTSFIPIRRISVVK